MNEKENTIDFLAIGDTATDVFIRLEEDSLAEVTGTPDTPSYRISLPFGEKIPYSQATTVAGVGNAPNAAVSASLLGLNSALVAHVGDDIAGEETINSLKEHGVNTTFVLKEQGKKTNYSYILWYKAERTILRKHEDFSYSLPSINNTTWIYFSAVGANAEKFYEEFSDYIEKNSEIKFAFQPGGNEIKLGKKLSRFYKRADIFVSNVEEAHQILGAVDLDIKELLQQMHALGPKIVVITDGPNGSYTYDGTEFLQMPIFPDPKPPYERTGAGDAFASTFTTALALGKSIAEALAWGGVNSMAVVQEIGAQKGLLSREKLEEYLKNAPEGYKATKI
jgi:sugar/nucleoside kinase (ribokinase family)